MRCLTCLVADHALAVIVERVTGQRLQDYLTLRLFEPLGIVGVEWGINSRDGIDEGARG
jgi:CubicO group peptidase (beta-lactamase class C family)